MEKVKLFQARIFLVKLVAVVCASGFFSLSAVAGAEDLSPLVSVSKSNEVSITDRVTLQATTTVNLTVQNLSDKAIQTPLHAVIDISAAGVTMPTALGGPGVLPYGKYYYDLSSKLSAGVLPSQGKVTFTAKFVRAASVRFTYKVLTYGSLPTNKPPLANAGTVALVTLQRGQTTVPVQLDGSASSDEDGTVTGYTWTGPVDPVDVARPSVSLGAGTHIFTLVVIDDKGAQSQPSRVLITVNPPPNDPPVANAGDNRTIQLLPGEQTATVTLSGSGTDADGTIASYAWTGMPEPADIAAPTVTLGPGTHLFYLVVTDNRGAASAQSQVTVTVVRADNRPPQLDHIGSKSVAEGGTLSFIISGSDPDLNPLTFAVTAGLPPGALFDAGSRQFSFAPNYNAAGNYDVTFSVSDGMSTIEEKVTVTVTNTNRPPVLSLIGPKTVAEGQKLEFTVAGADPDSEPLTAGARPLPAGAFLDPVTGLFSWTPGYAHAGTYVINFSISDGSGTSALTDAEAVSITVTDVNRAPVIVTQSLPAPKIDYAFAPAVAAADPDDDPLTFALGTGAPSEMTLDSATGLINWRPGIGEMGKSYTFDVSVTDGKGGSDSRRYTVAISDTIPPAIMLNVPKEAIPGSAFTATASATDNIGVVGMKIIAGDQEKSCTAANCEIGFSLSPVQAIGTSITVNVTAWDATGNLAEVARNVITVATPDTVKPVVTLSAPREVTAGTMITISALATDDQGVARLEFTADGADAGNVIPPSDSVSFVIPELPAGQKILFGVTAFDFSGNTASITEESTVVELPDTQAPVITLSTPAVIQPGTKLPVTLKVTDDRGVAGVELYLAHQKAASFPSALDQVVELTLPPGAEPGLQVLVEVRAVDAAGNSASASAESMVAVPGQGVVTGAVYNDATGLPLEGTTVVLTSAGTIVRDALTDRRGRYSLVADEGLYSVAVSKVGYTGVDRPGVVVAVQTGVRVADARLTPLGAENPVSTMLGSTVTASFSAASGGIASSLAAGDSPAVSGEIRISFPSGAFAADRSVAVTQIGGQGLQGRLPAGWSPIAAVDVAPHGVALRVAAPVSVPNLLGAVLPTQAVVATWHEETGTWRSLGAPSLSEDRATMTFEIPATAQYAVVVPDAGGGEALPAQTPLHAVANISVPEAVEATVTPQPKLILYKPGAKSLVGTRIASAAPLASGTVVRANIAEDYSFYGGERIVSEPYFQEIVLYSYGRTGFVSADYYISAGEDFAGLTLEKGVITVTALVPPSGSGAVSVVGPAGGTVAGPAGESLALASGALSGFVPVTVNSFSVAESDLSIPAGFRLLGGVTFSLAGYPLAKPAILSIPVPADFATAGDLLVVTPIETGGSTRLSVIGTATAAADVITSVITIPGTTSARFAGIRREGRVLVLQAAQALGYAGGTVSGTDGGAFAGAVVTGGGSPFVALSGETGFYATPVVPGSVELTALDLVKLDRGTAGGTIPATSYVPLDISLKIDPPRVVGVAPAKGAANVPLADPVKITLSEPVTAASVTPANVRVSSTAGDMAGSLDLNGDGTLVTFRHAEPFASNTVYTVTVEALVDRSSTTMVVPFTGTFTSINTAPPPAPPAGALNAEIPAGGRSTISATQGTASPHDTVFIVNLVTGERTPVIVDPDGGFTVTVNASEKDKLLVEITSPAGVTTTAQLPRFQKANPDGSISAIFGAEGGRLTVGTTNLDVPQGTFPGGTVLQVKTLSEADMGIPASPEFPFVAGLEIATSETPQKYINISAPLPSGIDPTITGIVAKVIDAYGKPAYAMVDTAKVIDGRLATSSPPCPGVVPNPPTVTPDGISDRVNRYAMMLNADQKMRYERVLATIHPPRYTQTGIVIEPFLIPLGLSGLPLPASRFVAYVETTPSPAYSQLCLVLPPEHQVAFVFRDARTGNVLKTIPVPNSSAAGNSLAITYVDTTDTVPARIVAHSPASNVLSMLNRSIELRFNEPIRDTNIADVITLVDPANNNALIDIDIKLSENNSVVKVTPKQLLTLGKRFRLKFTDLKDLAGNLSALPFIDFYTYAPKMIFPSPTARLDAATVASHLGVQASAITTSGLADLDIHTTPPQKSSDGKWHTDIIGITNSWGLGYGYRTFIFDAADPTKPKALSGLPVGNFKYMQKVQYLRNVSLIPRDVPGTEEWRRRELHSLASDPSIRLCADPTTSTGAAAIVAWQAGNNCSSASGACSVTTGGCGDLAVASGYDPVYSQFWMYDVTNLSSPNWYFGARLLSDNGEHRGYPRRYHTPAAFGMAKRFSLLSPVDITHKGQLHSNAFGAYIAVPGLGLELVDVGLNSPDIGDYERIAPSPPLTIAEEITLNRGGLYYQDVQVVRGKLVAIAGDRTDGTGIASIEMFDKNLAGPTSMLALQNIPNRMTTVEGFLSYDGDGNDIPEPHDVAFITGFDGGLSVVEVPDSTSAPLEVLAFLKTPTGTMTGHVEIDPAEKVAYVSATFPDGGVMKEGFLVADVSRLGAAVTPAIDPDGWDTRFIGKFPVTTFASGNVPVRGFRIDRQRGLLFAGIAGGPTSDAMVVFKIADCADIGVDFAEAPMKQPLPLTVEKRALQKYIAAGFDSATTKCGPTSLSGITMIEQGSGACLWRGPCKDNYQPGISDHDYELFFPSSANDNTRSCVIEEIARQFTEPLSQEPVELEMDGYKIKFDDISFFPMSKEEFENGKLNVMPPQTTTGDVTGDMGLGRQMLLLKWLLEGMYVEIPGYSLSGKEFASILALIKRADPAIPSNPVLDEPSRIKRLEGYEWAKLQEAEFYGTGALIRLVGEAKDGTTLQHLLEKQLHKVAKAGIRGVLARMISDTTANRYVLSEARGNVHTGMSCLDVPPASTFADWSPEPCDSFEHFVASVAARSVRDARMMLFTQTDIVDMIYPLYRMKAGKEHLKTEYEVNQFIGRAGKFLASLTDFSGPVKKVYDDTINNDSVSNQRQTNIDKAGQRAQTNKTAGKKQIVPRIFNQGGKDSREFALKFYVGTETAKEKVTLPPAEFRHMDVKKVPDPSDPTRTITKKIFVLSGIDQSSTSSGNKYLDFLVDLPEKLVEEPERKNNWDKLYYYILDPLGSYTPPTPPTPVLPIPDPNNDLLKPDNICVGTTPGLRVEQFVDGQRVESAIFFIGGACRPVDIVATNTSSINFTNVQVYSSITGQTYTESAIPAGGSKTFSFSYCPTASVGTVYSLVIPTADDADGKPIPLPVKTDVVALETHCPILIEPMDPDPNPEVSEVMFGGTFHRYYQVWDYSQNPVAPVTGKSINAEFVGSTYVSTNYTTDDKGFIVRPGGTAGNPEKGMAVPWSLWELTTIGDPVDIQATLKVPNTCAEPVKFSARLKKMDFEESLKAGAKIDVAASFAAELGLGVAGGLELGWEGVHDGQTDTWNNFSVGRSVGINGSVGAKTPEAKMKVSAGGRFGFQGPQASATLKFTVAGADKFEFALPMSDDDKLRFAGLTLNLVTESGSNIGGVFTPVMGYLTRQINDYISDFLAARTSIGVTGAVEVSGSASAFEFGLRAGFNELGKKGKGFNIGVSASEKFGFAATLEDLPKDKKVSSTGELSFELDLSAALDAKTTNLESEATTVPDNFDPNLKDFTNVWEDIASLKKLGSAQIGVSTGIKFKVVQNPAENMRPDLLEMTYKGKGQGGVKILGNQLLDLGPGFKMNRTYSVESTTEIYRVLNRMSNFDVLLDSAAWAYLRANPSMTLIMGPSQAAEWVAEFIALVMGNASYTDNMEKVQKGEIPLGIEAGLGAGVKAEVGLEAEYSHGYARQKGRLYRGKSVVLEDYSMIDHQPDTIPNLIGRVIGYYAKLRDLANFFRRAYKDPAKREVRSDGSAQMLFANDADFAQLQGLAAYDFAPLWGPVEPTRYAPDAVTAPGDKPHYGIGGFEQFQPVTGQSMTLSAPAKLTLHYHPEEVAGLDEDNLALYRFNETSQDWDLIGGTLDKSADTVTANVTSLGLYTLAPPMPGGAVTWQVESIQQLNAGKPDEKTILKAVAGPFTRNNGTPVPPGSKFHILSLSPGSASPDAPVYGTVRTADVDTAVSGTQVVSDAEGRIRVEVEYPAGAKSAKLVGYSDVGTTYGSRDIPLEASP